MLKAISKYESTTESSQPKAHEESVFHTHSADNEVGSNGAKQFTQGSHHAAQVNLAERIDQELDEEIVEAEGQPTERDHDQVNHDCPLLQVVHQ